MNILVRADSSSKIGIGHIMRDLVLVQKYENSNITFASQNLTGNINHKIIEQGYKLEILKSNDLDELDSLVKRLQIDFLIIDSYKIDYDFEKQIKEKNPDVKLMVFNDTYEKHYCDILLNHNIYAKEILYNGLVPNFCELRCGQEYTLIRDEFKKILETKKIVKDYICLAFGGSDHLNLNLKVLKLLDVFDIKIKVITTQANMYLNELKEYCKDKQNLDLYVNSNEVSKLFYNSKLVICSTSTVVQELNFLKVPFVGIKTANNQNMMYKYLKEKKYNVIDEYDEEKLLGQLKAINAF